MTAEIITIGDEILIGQIADTNSQWMAAELNKIGLRIDRIHSIADRRDAILNTLEEVSTRADLILITGGLGPTKDDITKKTIADFFGDQLEEREEVMDHVKALFQKWNYPFTRLNEGQALLPKRAEVITNHWGTAPGMWFDFDDNRKVIVSLPGVPYEMRQLMEHAILPRVERSFDLPVIRHRNILTYGIGESRVAERVEPWEDALPEHIGLAYLPDYGSLKLRLTATGQDKSVLDRELALEIEKLEEYISEYIVGYDESETLEVQVGNLLKASKQNLALAESCTGGNIAKMITAVPGASGYFKAGLVAYQAEVKQSQLGLSKELIEKNTVVSSAVAEAMAQNMRAKYETDYAISTTGNAGPTLDDTEESLGVVYIAVASKYGVVSERYSFGQPREKVIQRASNKALELLKREIVKNGC